MTRLRDFPTEAIPILKGMNFQQLHMLGIDIQREKGRESAASFPTDPEKAASEASGLMIREPKISISEPDLVVGAVLDVLRLVLGHEEAIDERDVLALWRLVDVACNIHDTRLEDADEVHRRLRAIAGIDP